MRLGSARGAQLQIERRQKISSPSEGRASAGPEIEFEKKGLPAPEVTLISTCFGVIAGQRLARPAEGSSPRQRFFVGNALPFCVFLGGLGFEEPIESSSPDPQKIRGFHFIADLFDHFSDILCLHFFE